MVSGGGSPSRGGPFQISTSGHKSPKRLRRGVIDTSVGRRRRGRIQDRRDARPVRVVLGSERLLCSLFDDLAEPGTQGTIRDKTLQQMHDSRGLVLKRVDLEALMVEAVDRTFESNLPRAIREECRELGLPL